MSVYVLTPRGYYACERTCVECGVGVITDSAWREAYAPHLPVPVNYAPGLWWCSGACSRAYVARAFGA